MFFVEVSWAVHTFSYNRRAKPWLSLKPEAYGWRCSSVVASILYPKALDLISQQWVQTNKRPKTTLKTGEMAKNTYSSWRIPGLVPNAYLEAHNNFLTPVSEDPTPSSDLHMFLHAYGAYTHTQAHTHI